MKNLLVAFLLLSVCLLPVIKGQTGSSDDSTTGTTGPVSTGVGSTTGTTGTRSYVSYFPGNNSTLNITLSVGEGSLDVQLPPIAGADYVVYGEAAPGEGEYQEPSATAPSGVQFAGLSFVITVYTGQGDPIHGALSSPMRVKISVPGVTSEHSMYFYNTDTEQWEDAAQTCSTRYSVIDLVAESITVDICHLTQFALFQAEQDEILQPPTESSSGLSDGLLATVIVVPIVVVGIVVGLIAFTLLRKKGNQRSGQSLEMGNRRPNPKTPALTAAAVKKTESSDESEDTSEDEEEDTSEEESESESDEEMQRDKPANEESDDSSSESESSSSEDESRSNSSSSSSKSSQ